MHVPATLVRGGTSKCWLFDHAHVPAALDQLERFLVDAYGAADPVQLDGVGGATPTTSKAAIVGPGQADGIDVDYLFGQVGIGVRKVEWGSNCGNCATAIALWAVARGSVPVVSDRTRVVMRNVNTGTVLEAEVDTTGGVVHEFGTATVPGTRSGGVAVGLTFLDPAGRTTGSLTPTGRVVDELEVDGTAVSATVIDAGAPIAVIGAESVGLTGTESTAEIEPFVGWLRAFRRVAALRTGLVQPGGVVNDAIPKVGIVGRPQPYVTSGGEPVDAADYDVSVRMLSMNAPHPAIGLTSAVGVAAASMLVGSIVHDASGVRPDTTLRIGTPAGIVPVTWEGGGNPGPHRVTVRRAARILCDAEIRVPEPQEPISA